MKTCSIKKCGGEVKAKGLCKSHYSRLLRHGPKFDRTPLRDFGESCAELIERCLREAVRSECWEWPKSRNKNGYGWANEDGKTVQAHRLVCQTAHGPPPTPQHQAIHSCDNPPCVNPHHLRWATGLENIKERGARDRTSRGSHHYKAKLDDDKVLAIIDRLRAGESEQSLAIEYGVTHGSIWFISRGRTWKHLQKQPAAKRKKNKTE